MFKKHFIPNNGNDYQPHILRKRAIFFILAFVLFVEVVFLIQMLLIIPYTDFFALVLPNVLVDLTNVDRQINNVSALKVSPLLEQAARLKAEDMAQKGYFSHNTPDGKSPWDWLTEVGYYYTSAGENLAINFVDSADIENAWMKSPSHRENILNNRYTEIGIATARGIYKGRESVFVVQFFARPASTKAQTTVPVKATKPKARPQSQTAIETDVVSPSVQLSEIPQNNGKTLGAKSSFLAKIFVAPKQLITVIYIFIAAVIFMALMLKIFVKIKIQYPKLIFNGVLVLFVIISVLYLNSLIIEQGMVF